MDKQEAEVWKVFIDALLKIILACIVGFVLLIQKAS